MTSKGVALEDVPRGKDNPDGEELSFPLSLTGGHILCTSSPHVSE